MESKAGQQCQCQFLLLFFGSPSTICLSFNCLPVTTILVAAFNTTLQQLSNHHAWVPAILLLLFFAVSHTNTHAHIYQCYVSN